MRYLRMAVAGLVLVAVGLGTALHVPVGTLCALCPVGFTELAVAGGAVPWELLPGVLALLAIVLLLGRVFCSWVCPTSLLRNVFGGRAPRGLTGRTGSCDACGTNPNGSREHSNLRSQGIVFAVLLVASLVVHFPVFCLICPIGLAFGTMFAVSRLFVTWQPGWELIVFPLMLFAEIFLLRRWCSAICPLGFFFSALARARAKIPFLPDPHVSKSRCLHNEGCNVCATVCPENISAATVDAYDLEDCTLCLDCTEHCPAKALSLSNRSSQD
ncbi:4Fe-4S binding protein [Adlercreutzia sp. R21]|uniref:4Fe-4S binding protein n=1 Tax=Adlercreutzia wanghongyangiae TaxID=3111451 RepID=UPI002DBA3633|nr:4Fe-4S binding protein [Adlercreutzia sp. R21]MEC4185164.1 4Fe-4S binding protein [Adlercreutzia sp. R21]